MCGPAALPALAIASAVVTAGGQIYSGAAKAQQANYEARLADRNASLASEQAHRAQENTTIEAQRRYRELSQVQGQQQASMAANGIDMGFGSALAVQRDTAMIGGEDVGQIYEGGFQKTRGFDISAANFGAEANAQRQNARNAKIETAFGVASTALGAAQQYGKLKASARG